MSLDPGGFGTSDDFAGALTEPELDRLADYLAGVLDQTDADQVASLIAADPRWSAAQLALADADVAVQQALAAEQASMGPMPDDIAARLDDVLRDLARTPVSAPAASTPQSPSLESLVEGASVAAARSGITFATVSSLAAARARRRRLLTNITIAAAAVVAVVGGVTVTANLTTTESSTSAAGSARDNAGAPAPADAGAGSGGQIPPASAIAPNLIVSGRNYTLDTLSQLPTSRPAPGLAAGDRNGATGFDTPQSATKAEVDQVPDSVRAHAPTALARLLTPAGLSSCLAAITAETPGAVTTVDYALFAGDPALVVLVRQGQSSTAVAVGPDCGLAGADRKGTASVP